MEVVIGLGRAGCNIAERFVKHPQYEVYCIDTEERKGKNFFLMKSQKSIEQYEKKTPSFKKFFSKIIKKRKDVLFIVAGGGDISGSALRILEGLKNCPTSVLFVKPDPDLINEKQKTKNKVVYGIIQEYARSGLLDKMYIVDNREVEKMIESVPIMMYNDIINDNIVSAFHMINVFKHNEAIFSNYSDELVPSARLCTVGVADFVTNENKMFFSLDMTRKIDYIYGINKTKLETEGNLLKKIKEQVSGNVTDDSVKASYTIIPTNYDYDIVYCIAASNLIQN